MPIDTSQQFFAEEHAMVDAIWTGNSPFNPGPNPGNPNADYNDALNWSGGVPTGTATFGASLRFLISFSANTNVDGWTFIGGPQYVFAMDESLGFHGAGIDASLGMLVIANSSTLSFYNQSSAGGSVISNSYVLFFGHDASAGNSVIDNIGSGYIIFSNNSSAGSSNIDNSDVGSRIIFNSGSSAENARIINNGITIFNGLSSASDAEISIQSIYAELHFAENSSAGDAAIDNHVEGDFRFLDNSTAGNASIATNRLYFSHDSSAGTSNIINNGNIYFTNTSTAEDSTIENNGFLGFSGNSTAGNARLMNASGAQIHLTNSSGPGSDNKLSVGSLSGEGIVALGANELTVGGNDLSTTFAGVIVDGITTGGSIVKAGTGTMILSGQNTYTGGTTVSGGTLQVDAGGKIGDALIKSGATLAGGGSVGTVTVEADGVLAPGASTGMLTIGALTLGGRIDVEIGGTSAGSGYDQVKVTGAVNLTGSTLAASLVGNFQPSKTTSQTFTIIDNDGADAVVGTFTRGFGSTSPLSEGATIIASDRIFKVSYKGGDGNDVTLTSFGVSRFGTSGNDTITGSEFADALDGLAGDDKLSSGGANDSLTGDAGNDTLDGGAGTDNAIYQSVSWKDLLVTGSGSTYTVRDMRTGSPLGTDTLISVEQLDISGRISSIGNAVRAAPTGTAIPARKIKEGKAFSFDTSKHFSDKNAAFGDVLTYALSAAPAWLKINAATGVLSGTPGIDDQSIRKVTIVATDLHGFKVESGFTLTVADVTTTFAGDGKSDTIRGTVSTDLILGKGGKDKIFGLAGKDTLEGGNDDDLLVGGRGADKLRGGAGRDTASYQDAKKGVVASLAKPGQNKEDAKGDTYASVENLTGSAFADRLTGDGRANVLKGGGGNDRLEGGKGPDTLSGSKGADRFVFTSIEDSPAKKNAWDVIIDFERKQGDRIDLKAIDARKGKKNQAFVFIEKDAFSGRMGELRFEKAAKKTFVYGDVDGDGRADLKIELIGKTELVTADFML